MSTRNRKLAMLVATIVLAATECRAQGIPAGDGDRAAAKRPVLINGGRYVVAITPSGDRIWAHGIEAAAKWEVYRAPAGTKLGYIEAADFIATTAEGDRITQVAVFSTRSGVWRTQDLRAPASGRLVPTVGPILAAYVSGRTVYAFSAEADRWDVLELPEGSTSQPIVNFWSITVQGGDLVSVFISKSGHWDTIDLGK